MNGTYQGTDQLRVFIRADSEFWAKAINSLKYEDKNSWQFPSSPSCRKIFSHSVLSSILGDLHDLFCDGDIKSQLVAVKLTKVITAP